MSIAIGDVNSDGSPDLVVANSCTGRPEFHNCKTGAIGILLGNGDGSFQTAVTYKSGPSDSFHSQAAIITDVNGDGRVDVLAANLCNVARCSAGKWTGGTVSVLLNDSIVATTTSLVSSPNPSQVNQAVNFTATITPTPADDEVVTFYSGKTIVGTGKTTKGVATLTKSFTLAKTYTIKVGYTGDAFHKPSSGTVKQIVNP